jgi:peroxiredoxin
MSLSPWSLSRKTVLGIIFISHQEEDMTPNIGQPAPDFALTSHDKQEIRLGDYQTSKNVVLAFFPLAWTPV